MASCPGSTRPASAAATSGADDPDEDMDNDDDFYQCCNAALIMDVKLSYLPLPPQPFWKPTAAAVAARGKGLIADYSMPLRTQCCLEGGHNQSSQMGSGRIQCSWRAAADAQFAPPWVFCRAVLALENTPQVGLSAWYEDSLAQGHRWSLSG